MHNPNTIRDYAGTEFPVFTPQRFTFTSLSKKKKIFLLFSTTNSLNMQNVYHSAGTLCVNKNCFQKLQPH